MIFNETIASGMSGSIGGITASHNKGGPYFRNKAIPTNPNTPEQAVVRGYMSQLANLWVNVLTQAQRDAWDTYALNTPIVNAIGNTINVTGLNMYQRGNVARLQAGEPRVDDGPVIFDVGDFTQPAFSGVAAVGDINVIFTNTDDWANEDDAAMLVYGSRSQNPSINFFKGPYQLAGVIQGDSTTPPTSPASIASPFPFTAGNKTFVRVAVTRADGRYSNPFRGELTAA